MSHMELQLAERIAKREHATQTRRHGAPYIAHPKAVCELLDDLGAAIGFPIDDEMRATAWLHDVIEDGNITTMQLREQVGPRICSRVEKLSKSPRAPGENKATQTRRYFETLMTQADDKDRLLKVADRLHNLSELHLSKDAPPAPRYLEETRNYVLPLAQNASSAPLARALTTCLQEAMALAAKLQHIDAQEVVSWRTKGLQGLYAIIDVHPNVQLDDARQRVREALEGGASYLQLRCKSMEDQQVLELVEEFVPLARACAVPFFLNDRPDIAGIGGADGVHVGQSDLAPTKIRDVIRAPLRIGQSTHTDEQFQKAMVDSNLDYIAWGPVYASPTKSGHAEITGLAALRGHAMQSTRPICAIGGIVSTTRMAEVARAGAQLGAVISALERAPSIRWMARRLSLSHAAAFALQHCSQEEAQCVP